MTLVDDDIVAARRAARALGEAVADLLRHYGDTPDTRRLQSDAARLPDDLDLLCGREAVAAAAPAPAPERATYPDSSYTHDFWMDAEDEGLGRTEGWKR